MNEPIVMDKAEERRRHLLARVAGNIASGLVSLEAVLFREGPGEIAERAVSIARSILDEVGL